MDVFFFYTLATILVVFAVLTVTAGNPVRSAVYLVSALVAVAGLFVLLKAEFLGAVQILVYVGGIMVLFLFVIMLVNVREVEKQRKVGPQWKTALILGVVLSAELIFFIVQGTASLDTKLVGHGIVVPDHTQNTESVGRVLYQTYLLPFEIASVLLLVAIVGAVVLAKKEL